MPTTGYPTLADLQATGIASSATTVPGSLADPNACLTNAIDTWESYAKSQFTLPFVSVGPDIKQKVIDIASWYYLKARGFNPSSPGDIAVRQTYEDAIRWCEHVSQKRVYPTAVDSASPANAQSAPKVQRMRSHWDKFMR